MKRFNTSHVTLYRELADCLDYDVIRFNTSHVTLYHNQITTQESIKRSFNTSHVTLYLQQMVADADEVTFQYISCYSLSNVSFL